MRIFVLTALLSLTAASAHADRVLVIGDSLSCGHFGDNLIAGLSTQGHQVTMYCAVGSSPENWMNGHPARASWPCEIHTYDASRVGRQKTAPHVEAVKTRNCGGFPKLREILNSNPSDHVVIALGTNSLPDGPDASYDRMLDAVATSSRTCDWILPPHLEPGRAKSAAGRRDLAQKEAALWDSTHHRPGRFYNQLESKLNHRCSAISSLAATAPGTDGNQTGEGIHATAKAGRARYLAQQAEIERALRQTRESQGTQDARTHKGVH